MATGQTARPALRRGDSVRGPRLLAVRIVGRCEPLQAGAADGPVLDVGDHHTDVAEADPDVGLRQLPQGLEDEAIEGARAVERKCGAELAVQVPQAHAALDLGLAALVPAQAR